MYVCIHLDYISHLIHRTISTFSSTLTDEALYDFLILVGDPQKYIFMVREVDPAAGTNDCESNPSFA